MEASDRRRETNASDGYSPRGVKPSRSPPTRSNAKEVGMFISVVPHSGNRQLLQQPLHELRPSAPEWVMAESPVATTSMFHNKVGGCGVGLATNAPTRHISASSSLQSKIATTTTTTRRVSSKRQRGKVNESRFGMARKNLSKTVQSLQVIRNELERKSSSNGTKMVQSIATQTSDPDEIAAEAATTTAATNTAFEASRRTSRIPIPCEKGAPREKTPVPIYRETNPAAEPCVSSYSLGNVYSLMTTSVSETKLENICAPSDLSVSVRPVLEAQESCTVLDVNVLRLAEVRRKEIDVDRTLENWKPTTAVVSLVPEVKAKSTSKKSIVKKDRSKDDKSKNEDESPPASGKVPVVDLDKEAFEVPPAKSKHSEKRSSRRERNGHETSREDENSGGKQQHSGNLGSNGGGSSCRVRFSPHLIAPSAAAASAAAATSPTREKSSNTSTKAAATTAAASPTNNVASISKFPELLKRVTDQAITSIAKTVILGLPQQLLRYDLHPAGPFSSHHSPGSSQSFAGNYQSAPAYSRAPPMTMSSLNMHDDSGGGYRLPSRNPSQLSVTSLINYPSNGGGAHLPGRYAYVSPHNRMSSSSNPKTRKELDNRYSLHHQWDARTPVSKNSWVHDSSSVYSIHSGEYGSRPGSGNQFWLRNQRLRNPWSTTSSSSSLYTPQKTPKYERPSQRFSSIRNHSGMHTSLEDLHNSTMNNQAMERGMVDSSTTTTSYNEHMYV